MRYRCEPLIDPGTKPVDQYYRELHFPLDRERRELIDRILPNKIHRDFVGQIVQIGDISRPFRHGR